MRILTIHSDYVKVWPKRKAISSAEELKKKEYSIKESLVVLTAVEKVDEDNTKEASRKLSEEIRKIAEQVKTRKIVLYPYAHLSSNLAAPEKALEIMKLAEKLLKKKYEVTRVPFGWYKQFELKCKGHPLSELSREFKPESKIKKRKKGSEFSKFILIDKNGEAHDVTKKNWKKCKIWNKKGEDYKRLQIFARNELEGHKSELKEPKHIQYMRNLELVDYCPESHGGHFRWFPNGLLIKDLILMFNEKLARNYGAFKISNPLLYKLSVPDINQLLGEFHEKDYSWMEDNEELVLRFASDPGAFPFMRKIHFSYKDMPIKEYEEAICFRKEQSGELTGLRRVRNFLMTDMHVFCIDLRQTRDEYEKLCFICQELMDSVISKGRWILGWEGTEDFYKENRKWLLNIIKKMNVPSLIKLMKKRGHYYSLKNEYQSIEADEANSQISTVQLDVINGKRFNIRYIDKDGKGKPCMIIHCSTFGSIERTLCALLENAALDEKSGRAPMLPLWLSPTQIRLIPVSIKRHLKFSKDLAEKFEKENIRVDVDDTVETVSKRIMNAEKDWVPYTLVIGDKEIKSKNLNVRIRENGKQKKMGNASLIKEIKSQTKDLPFKPLALDKMLSKRPVFL